MFSYVCSTWNTDLCVALPTGGEIATSTLPAVLKSAVRNKNKVGGNGLSADYAKMRWIFNVTSQRISYAANPTLCLHASALDPVVRVDACDDDAVWNLRDFTNDDGRGLPLVHASTQKCLGVMHCLEKQAKVGTFCEPVIRNPRPATPPFVLGSNLRLFDCSSAAAMQWTTAQDCAPGCPPFLLKNGRCNAPCAVLSCAFDGGDCTSGPTTSPTPPTSSPSRAPSQTPSKAPSTPRPSRKPSTPKPSTHPSPKPSTHPSPKPSENPSQKPSETPSQKPSEHPSAKPSPTPSLHPTQTPSLAFVNVTNTTTAAATEWPWQIAETWWIIVLAFGLLGICGTIIAVGIARRNRNRRNKKQEAAAPEAAPEATQEPEPEINGDGDTQRDRIFSRNDPTPPFPPPDAVANVMRPPTPGAAATATLREEDEEI